MPTQPPSAAEDVAEKLRQQMHLGALRPGQRITEPHWAETLGVSRNTLREGLRILVRDHLADYYPHRGVFVHHPTAADVADLFAFRRFCEVPAVSRLHSDAAYAAGVERMRAAITGITADSPEAHLAQSNLDFHQGIIALTGIRSMEAAIRTSMEHLRLAFLCVPDSAALHRDYAPRNREILHLVQAQDFAAAAAALSRYLTETEAAVLHNLRDPQD